MKFFLFDTDFIVEEMFQTLLKNMDSSLDCNLKCTFGNGQTLKIVDRPNIGKLST